MHSIAEEGELNENGDEINDSDKVSTPDHKKVVEDDRRNTSKT